MPETDDLDAPAVFEVETAGFFDLAMTLGRLAGLGLVETSPLAFADVDPVDMRPFDGELLASMSVAAAFACESFAGSGFACGFASALFSVSAGFTGSSAFAGTAVFCDTAEDASFASGFTSSGFDVLATAFGGSSTGV
ncbi:MULTISPECIES: hypothetical protein [Thalassospira]|uniref:hypothetical protein n=1 Tax=Thalassospira TaxID=168934 RepID=UPI0018D3A1D8|nr:MULTISPECIES: hypothetical protein [Thalassospira]MCH2275556.1 hypothetical protein [Thalassospira sp.]